MLVCPEKQIQKEALWKGWGLQLLKGSAEEIWSLGQLEWVDAQRPTLEMETQVYTWPCLTIWTWRQPVFVYGYHY